MAGLVTFLELSKSVNFIPLNIPLKVLNVIIDMKDMSRKMYQRCSCFGEDRLGIEIRIRQGRVDCNRYDGNWTKRIV